MNYYVDLISSAVNFIEENIQKPLTLEDLSQEFNFSAFHFNRIFRTVSGISLKQYILGRKLTLALSKLEKKSDPIINIAYDFGFNSPEVFSRAFKKQFGVSPNLYRVGGCKVEPISKVKIVERDIINFQGQMALKGSEVFLKQINLDGIRVPINVNQSGFENTLKSTGDRLVSKTKNFEKKYSDELFALVSCSGEEDGEYEVFYGLEPIGQLGSNHLESRYIPSGWYEKFIYVGNIFDVRLSFTEDLYRWVMVKEIVIDSIGIGMINIFQPDYYQTQRVEILVPIKHSSK